MVINVVILLSERKSKIEKEIIEILQKYGGNHISDKNITETQSKFTIITVYKKTEITLNKGAVVFVEKTHRFKEQKFPIGIIGICEEKNKTAFETFKKSNNAVITCGINNKNTVTLSSINKDNLLITLQRSLIDINGNHIYPCEFKIKLTKAYAPFSIMSAATVLLLNGITPQEF